MRTAILLLVACCILKNTGAQEINIIPQPRSVTVKSGHFTISPSTPIVAVAKSDKNVAALLNSYLKSYYGFTLPVVAKGTKGIILATQPASGEGYSLESAPNAISITGNSEAGTFYGIQSLIQLLPVERSAALAVPAVSITDAPAMAYRGMMLDVCRHFFPVEFVKKYIDYIALHKMNYFHWHLTDDQGWRIEIKKYPKLTAVGAWRNGTIIGNFPGSGNDNLKYGGFYTQEQVKEIVAYAAKRYITVIPEIEMPGHASAAIAAYPYLSCFPDESTKAPKGTTWSGPQTGKQVQQTWGVFPDVFCAGKESTFRFLEDVLSEVLPLFPSKYVHIGGDECPKENWKRCPVCQKRIKDNNLKDEHELQSYFVHRMEKFINSKGKNIIGWDEILEGGLAPNATVMSWRGEKGGIEAAQQKHQVIMTPNNYVYFDYQQAPNEDSVTITHNKSHLPVEKVYNWEIIPPSLNDDEKKLIWGGQANLWTEYIGNPKKVEYMIFPRMSALAEALWTPKPERNFDDFNKRLETQKKRYDLWNANYYGKK
ncbi:beta-N-acetylhexosaminidase [Niabella ginsenosidivorans]|uniref:beta-N-acetylhexosaminidase n=1 Tax=Niabella ginsenosidivorans TaxID=1176587 RepID=A0A1A9I1B0_9BACT|nr:beta-N-acetylhexosaminidase [Niabella ginsenosidivorans]ANH80849.1 beta-N-acetylhexosaminidase [Niabella ginsenosidivorans]